MIRLLSRIPPVLAFLIAGIGLLIASWNALNWSDAPKRAADKAAFGTIALAASVALVVLGLGAAGARRLVAGRSTPRRLLGIAVVLVVITAAAIGLLYWSGHR